MKMSIISKAGDVALVAVEQQPVVQQHIEFRQARTRAKARLELGYDLGWTAPSPRDEIYGR